MQLLLILAIVALVVYLLTRKKETMTAHTSGNLITDFLGAFKYKPAQNKKKTKPTQKKKKKKPKPAQTTDSASTATATATSASTA
jgi:hypothetical protein